MYHSCPRKVLYFVTCRLNAIKTSELFFLDFAKNFAGINAMSITCCPISLAHFSKYIKAGTDSKATNSFQNFRKSINDINGKKELSG